MTIKEWIRHFTGWVAGVDKLQVQVDTLYYFLNYYKDVRDFPPAAGPLGLLQKGDTLLLEIVDSVCKKHNLPYWLDAGTCLAAVRQQRFIPWDDDMDICMLREDYERARPILERELGRYGIEAKESSRDAAARIGIGYKHYQTGIWVDLRPYECLEEDYTKGAKRRKLSSKLNRYRRIYNRKREGLSRENVFLLQCKHVGKFCKKREAKTLIRSMEFDTKNRMWHADDFFPLGKAMFEGREYSVPRNTDAFLTQFFGNEYMGFPRGGLEHHGGKNGKLQTWAAKSGTDMNQVIQELENILAAIENEE